MHVHTLSIAGFTKHTDTHLTLPPKGILLVTGPNGAGKSSLPEAVSFALWNKPLRKRTGRKALRMWRRAGEIKVTTDRVWATRKSTGKLAWGPLGNDAEAFTTTSKAQEALEELIGEHELWARSKVFSSSDASHFTLAKDSERKRLLEMVLKLDVFDTAYDQCKKDLRKQELLVSERSARIDVLNERIEGLKEQLAEIPRGAKAPKIDREVVTMRTADEVCTQLKKRIDQVKIEQRAVSELRDEAEVSFGLSEKKRDAVDRAQEALTRSLAGVCTLCGSALTQEHQKQAKKRLASAKQELEAALEALHDARTGVTAAQRRAEAAQGDAEKARELLRAVEDFVAATEAAKRQRWNLGDKLEEAEELRGTATLELAQASAEAEELKAAAQALGLTGIRASMLTAALSGIEQVANAWLARFSAGGDTPISVRMESYSENAKGTVTDSISLELFGVAIPDNADPNVGQDYGAVSGGERRRVDISFMLALAEIEAGASGQDAGTLWFDEVFDWLDEEGRESAFEILAELAETACVVVITHNKQLISGLMPQVAAFWHVEGGTVYDRKDGKALTPRPADRERRVGKEKLPRPNGKPDAVRHVRGARRAGRGHSGA